MTLFWGVIVILATDTGNEFSRFAWLFPVALIATMLMAALVVFVSAVATMALSSLVIAVSVIMLATPGDDSTSWGSLAWNHYLFLFGTPVVVLALSTWLVTMGGGTLRRSTEPRVSLPLVGAAIIGCALLSFTRS